MSSPALETLQQSLARLPVAALSGVSACMSAPDGEVELMAADETLARLTETPHLMCHAPFLVRRLSVVAHADRARQKAALAPRHLDVAELYAFVRPAQFALPTPVGLARAVGIPAVELEMDPVQLLPRVAMALLGELASKNYPLRRETAQIATFLAATNWPWAQAVLQAINAAGEPVEVSAFATLHMNANVQPGWTTVCRW